MIIRAHEKSGSITVKIGIGTYGGVLNEPPKRISINFLEKFFVDFLRRNFERSPRVTTGKIGKRISGKNLSWWIFINNLWKLLDVVA